MNRYKEQFLEFLKFGIVGISNTVISYVTYAALVFLGSHYLVASVISFAVSVLNSFYWNSKYVFVLGEGESRSPIRTLWKTFCAYAFTGLFLNNVLLILEVGIFGINEYVAPLLNLIVSVPVNYLINKFWAYRKK